MSWIVVISLLIPLLGTTLGSAMVFFLKDNINPKLQKILLGFASGVMIAASIWSLLEPAIGTYNDFKKWLIPAIGFLVGIGFLLLLDYLIPHIHMDKQEEGIKRNKLSKTFKMFLAVTLHNIPEGLAVGVVIAGMISGNINEHAMLALSIGIAIQNFPEGAIISMPLKEEGFSKTKAFLYGFGSGIVEPIAALIAILLTYYVSTILPFVLAFAAGAMIYVVVEELIPEANTGNHSNLATIGLAIGFVLMMVLDIALG
ncbi:MAG: ZIP family metal transporter [Acholeplasmatales bacterium]|nr:ZIP family metal transporter [Acholeplasmatales bacterium]